MEHYDLRGGPWASCFDLVRPVEHLERYRSGGPVGRTRTLERTRRGLRRVTTILGRGGLRGARGHSLPGHGAAGRACGRSISWAALLSIVSHPSASLQG